LPTMQASPRTGLTLPPRWCHRHQARALFSLTGVPWTCPKHRSTAVIHGQQGSVRVPSDLRIAPYGSGPRELPKLAVGRAGAATGSQTTGTLRTTMGSHSHHLSGSIALLGRAPQVTVTRRFALTRKGSQLLRFDFEPSRLAQASNPQPARPCASALPRHAPSPRPPGPAWHAPWPGRLATHPARRCPRALRATSSSTWATASAASATRSRSVRLCACACSARASRSGLPASGSAIVNTQVPFNA
jgi:hypothetical protein